MVIKPSLVLLVNLFFFNWNEIIFKFLFFNFFIHFISSFFLKKKTIAYVNMLIYILFVIQFLSRLTFELNLITMI
jgi:hypothetical protein